MATAYASSYFESREAVAPPFSDLRVCCLSRLHLHLTLRAERKVLPCLHLVSGAFKLLLASLCQNLAKATITALRLALSTGGATTDARQHPLALAASGVG